MPLPPLPVTEESPEEMREDGQTTSSREFGQTFNTENQNISDEDTDGKTFKFTTIAGVDEIDDRKKKKED